MSQKHFTVTSNEMFSDNFTVEAIDENNFVPILKKISNHENGAVNECLEYYGSFIWAIAKKYSQSKTDAEKAVREIFLDIWGNAENFDGDNFEEQAFIARIALRRLLKINKQPIN